MSEKKRALEQVIEIAKAHDLDIEDISAALAAPDGAAVAMGEDDTRASVLTRALGYLGGTFVFAGLGVFIAMHWDNMNVAARIVITLGAGIAAFIMAVVAVSDERYEKAAAPLFLIAAFLEPAGLLVVFDEFYSDLDWQTVGMIVSATIAAQQLLTFGAHRRTTLLFIAVVFVSGFGLLLFDSLDVDQEITALILGASLVSVCVGLDRSPHAAITPFWYFVGSGSALFGLFDVLQNTPIEVLFLAAASGVVYLSTVVRSRTLLLVATIAILAYIGYFSAEHFVKSIGWPLALILFGIVLIGLSSLAFRINRRYIGSTD